MEAYNLELCIMCIKVIVERSVLLFKNIGHKLNARQTRAAIHTLIHTSLLNESFFNHYCTTEWMLCRIGATSVVLRAPFHLPGRSGFDLAQVRLYL